ncbi:MAG: BMP family lipoprotein [Bacillota bacterium]
MKRFLSIVVCVMLVMSMAACAKTPAPAPNANPAPNTTPAAAAKIVTMATDMGGVNDASFNQSAWAGLQKLNKELTDAKVKVSYQESTAQEQYSPNLRTLVETKKSELTWAIGYMMAEDLQKVADQFKDKKFAIIDSAPATPDKAQSNVTYVTFKEEEGSFLVGYIAGMTTKSGKVGFVGGMTGDLIKKFESGFKAGVKAARKDADIKVAYAESWIDSGKGEQLATGMYNQGVDVIYHAAGATGKGVFDAAVKKGAGFWVIGVDQDQKALAPNNTLTSMMKRVDQATYQISKDFVDGKFNGGKTIVLGLKDGGVGISDSSRQTLNKDILAKVDDYAKKIQNGELKVPTTDAEYDAYVKNLK